MVTGAPDRADIGKLILRLALAGILLFHGIFKIRNGVAWIEGPLGELGLPAFLAYGPYIAEVGAPVLLIAGFRTRLAALVIAVNMAMAVVLVLRDDLFTIRDAGGGWAIELEAMLFFTALALVFTGGGRLSVLRKLGRWD